MTAAEDNVWTVAGAQYHREMLNKTQDRWLSEHVLFIVLKDVNLFFLLVK